MTGDQAARGRAALKSWGLVGGTVGGILIAGVIAEPISSGWRAPSADLYSDAAVTAPVLALALFLEIAVVMAPVIKEEGVNVAGATVRTLVRMNAAMLLMSEAASLYAVGAQRATAFLTVTSLVPWLVQLLFLVDTAYVKVGLNRIGRRRR